MSTDARPYAEQVNPPGPPAGSRRRRWLIVLTAGWAVLLFVLSYVSARADEPTVREQRDIAQAVPRLDRAVGQLVAAAGPRAVVEIAPRRLVRGCRITPVRDGAVLSQRMLLRTAPADGPDLLDRIAERLPADYAAEAWHSANGQTHRLWADAGEFVVVKGHLTEPGLVVVTAETGCRPLDPGTDPLAGLLPGTSADEQPGRVLAALGATGVRTAERVGVSCPSGGTAYTVRASGQGAPPPDPGARLSALAGTDAVVVSDSPQLYAYRSGGLSVVVEARDGEIRVATTSGC